MHPETALIVVGGQQTAAMYAYTYGSCVGMPQQRNSLRTINTALQTGLGEAVRYEAATLANKSRKDKPSATSAQPPVVGWGWKDAI